MLKILIAENLHNWEKGFLAPPTQISITPTNLCNLKCQSCWQRDNDNADNNRKPVEISEEKLCQVVKEAGDLGVRCIELTGGGEPLVRNKASIRLIKEIKNRGMIGWMTSNGTLFTSEIIKLMVELEWDKLTISLDGPDADINDFLRPPKGSFEKILSVLAMFNDYKKLLNKKKPQITFNSVVSKHNINKLNEIIHLAKKYGVEGVTFETVKVLSAQCESLLIDFENDYNKIIKELERAHATASEIGIFTNISGLLSTPELIRYSGKLLTSLPAISYSSKECKLLDIPCIEPWFHIYLEADGNVRPCCVNPGIGENIHDKSLKEIWFGEKFSSFRGSILRKNYPLSCNQCNANLICFSREIQELLKEKILLNDSPIVRKQPKVFLGKEQIKILITDTAPLYPPLWGGPKRILNLYSNFSKDLFDITYVGVHFNLGSEGKSKYKFKRIEDNFKEILTSFPAHYYFWHSFEKAFFKNTFLDLFVYLWMHTDWQFKYILNAQDADIVIFSHPWSSLCVNKNKTQFFIYDAHNCEFLLMKQILKKHFLKNIVLRQVRKIEGEACKKSDLILACSENEKRDLINLYKLKDDKIIIVPNGASLREDFNRGESLLCREKIGFTSDDTVVVFVGAYYKPNIDAAKFIVERIAPQLNEYKFLIIGTVSDAFKSNKIPNNVKLLGLVSKEQLDASLIASDIAINPMHEGSGINIKMLDYMSYGLPIVTTECGARGIETLGSSPMIVSSDDDFVSEIKKLISNKAMQKKLSEEGQRLIVTQYEWKRISEDLQNSILGRLKKKDAQSY